MSYFTVVFAALIIFIGIALFTTLSRDNKYITAVLAIGTCMVGFVIYGSGYAGAESNLFTAALKTVISTVKMFLGNNAYGDIAGNGLVSETLGQIVFWVVHFIAFAITTKTIIMAFGSKAIQQIRILMARKGKLAIIYGVNADSIAFGESLRKNRGYTTVFVDHGVDAGSLALFQNGANGLLFSDVSAWQPSVKFLKQLGAYNKNRKIVVYALHENEVDNTAYAKKMAALLRTTRVIPKENIALTILANMELNYGEMFQAKQKDEYGFGSVMVVDRPYLIAQSLVEHYPPCNYVKFDHATCLATTNFHAVIIGYGKIGQAVLRKLVMNAQFEGSTCHIDVYDPDCEAIQECIQFNNEELFEKYDIVFHQNKAQSVGLYKMLANTEKVNYIAVCIKNADRNSEVATELQSVLCRYGSKADVFQCTDEGIYRNNYETTTLEEVPIYSKESLDIESADSMAMTLNYIYCHSNADGPDKKPLDYWVTASYMDKMSSRASADFSKAFLKCMGKTEAEIIRKGNLEDLTAKQLENLSKTEHLRWCAFHYCMGYKTMPREIWKKRGVQYQAEVAKLGMSKMKIQKDDAARMHICLVPWEELDELSKEYEAFTGKSKNYKQDDTNNVLMLPEILK